MGWCKQCSIQNRRKTKQEYHSMALEKGIRWIGNKLPLNNRESTLWHCLRCSLQWKSNYAQVRSNVIGCPKCGKEITASRQRKKAKDYHNLAKSKSLQWLGSVLPRNTKQKTFWRCTRCNFHWETTYNNVYLCVIGCPECAKRENVQKLRHTKSDYHSLAKQMEIEWIGKFPSNSKTKTLWRCKKGHIWMSRYNDIQSGYSCPTCANMVNGKLVSISQVKLANRIGGILNYKTSSIWIDIAFPEQKVAIEYDSWFCHYNRQEQDSQRVIELIDLGWKVLSVKSNTKVPSKSQIKQKLYLLSPDIPYQELVLSDWGNGVTNSILRN